MMLTGAGQLTTGRQTLILIFEGNAHETHGSLKITAYPNTVTNCISRQGAAIVLSLNGSFVQNVN